MFTATEIKRILRQERLSISRRRGQNFLVDANLQRKIIEAVQPKQDDEILEIGPGLGALTEGLADKAAKIFAVEKDRGLVRILERIFSGLDNLKIIHQDILRLDLKDLTERKCKVVGNLPYYITTPIIACLLEKYHRQIKEIFVAVQYEVGKRLTAKTGSKDYSALTVMVRYFSQAELLFPIPKRAFYPQPKVNSVFVHLTVLDRPPVEVNNQKEFFKIVRACFNQRRKTVLNSLSNQAPKIGKSKIEQCLLQAGIDLRARAENLDLKQFSRIENIFYKRRIRFE